MQKFQEEGKKSQSAKDNELYRQTENIQELKDKLRDTYLAYKESAGRCKLEMKPKGIPGSAVQSGGKGPGSQEKEFQNFYIPPSIPQLQEPEKQKKFRNEYIAEVGQRPQGEQLAYLADTLHLEALETIADGSHPSRVRETLAPFFKRHAVYLRHKKYMMLGRWANEMRHSRQVDQAGTHFDRMVSRLQQELDSAINRGDRLERDDSYDAAIDPSAQRPQPTSTEQDGTKNGALLYVEAPGKSINSVIRQDDCEVFLRITTYRSRLFRTPEKLATSIKWLPHSHRFDIWKQSRMQICQYKAGFEAEREKVLRPIEQRCKEHLIAEGVMDKLRDIVEGKYVSHLRGKIAASRVDELKTCYTCTHERPPFLFTCNVELRSKLVPLAREWALTVEGYLDIDDGSQFTYQVNGLFPPEFQKQVLEMQFDALDSGEGTQADTDILLIQKLTTELGLDKHEMLGEMSKQAAIERDKSILGQIKQDQHQPEGAQARPGGSSTSDKNEDVARANLIRRIKEMNFFSLDVTEYKLKKADWLEYVCWQPTISEVVMRQNFALSSLSSNPVDSLLMSAFEFIDVNEAGAANKILEDSATAHVRKVRGYFAEISQKNPWTGHGSPSETVEAVLREATLGPINGIQRKEQPQRSDDVQYDPSKVESQIQSIDPLKQHLVKSYYSLRLLKCRGIKTKILQALNYFRAVQKRLAFDVREYYTRERALGGRPIEESLIGPQFGKDEAGNLKAKKGGTGGPGGINANRIERELDDGTGNIKRENEQEMSTDPVSLKGYKYNKRFNPALTSTCPCVPRFHSTFGRPTLYEDVSQEMERRHGDDGKWRSRATSIPAYKDRLIFKRTTGGHAGCEIAVVDEDGTKVVFEEALNDMLLLEEEMLKVGSFFLNKGEFQQHTGATEQPSTMLDRGEVALHLFEQELELQLTKASLVETLLEAYEHTCDPLESVRVLQVIVDTMAVRPRVNLDATYFRDSYSEEIAVIRERLLLYQEVMEVQTKTERAQNSEIRKFQELKLRKLTDFVEGDWKYEHEPAMVERIGTREEQERGQSLTEARQGKRAQYQKEMQKQLALREIAERHITEFAGDQHTDFANVLGLPEVTASDLFKKQAQQDPIVVDAIREHTHMSKQIEGYPWFFRGPEETRASIGLQTTGAGLTDFFDSLCAVTRVHAACVQGFGELSTVHRPENGLASSCLEKAMLAEARGRLRVLRNQDEEGVHNLTKAANRIEEDFYYSSSDKLVFLMREFKAELNPDTVHKTASPLLVGKLAVSEVAKFDFPRIKQGEVERYEELNDEQLTRQMIALAKVSISRPIGGEMKAAEGSEGGTPRGEVDAEELRSMQIQSPSMMILACNTLEVLRLRKALIKLVHETDVLEDIIKQQQKETNTSGGKLVLSEGIPFETQSIAKGNMNLVDLNDGSNLELDLAAREFDGTLKAGLDFRSESCVKALMTDLGVEELRAVVHYQLMQKQLLTIAVMRNQLLMDGPQQGGAEVELMKTKIAKTRVLVPAAQVRHKAVITNEGVREELLEKERRRLSSQLTKDVASHMYPVPQRKSEQRTAVSTKYAQAYQKVLGSTKSAETKLRILRAYRLRLLHEFCRDVLRQAYSDSLSIQALQACRELRRKAYLFPKEPALFSVGLGFPEHLPAALFGAAEEAEGSGSPKGEGHSLSQLLGGRPKTLFYIPTGGEIMEATQNQPTGLVAPSPEPFNESDIDESVKRLCKPPTRHLISQSQHLPANRAVAFQEAYAYRSRPAELLQFCALMLQIVSIEYLMGRNNAPGEQILELEGSALSGRPLWEVKQPAPVSAQEPEEEAPRYAPERVLAKIMHRKRARVDLAEDLGQISRRLLSMDQFVKSTNSDHLKLPYLLDLLELQHQSSFLHFMNGLENTLDIYLDHRSDDCFAKIQEALNTLARRDAGFNLLGNGLYLNQGTRRGTQIDLCASVLEDADQFARCYQPVVDESAMVPPQLGLVRRLYGFAALEPARAPTGLLSLATPDYGQMACSFLNLDDEQRSFIATNFYQLEEGLQEYLVFSGHVPDPAAQKAAAKAGGGGGALHIPRPKEILQAQVEYLGLKVEARHLQRVLMSWSTCSALPNAVEGYQTALTLYREQTMLKILLERDALTEQYYESKSPSAEGGSALGAAAKKRAQERATILESVNPFSREHTVISRLHQTKAEISVARRVLDVEMIRMSLDMIQREHGALQAAFEQGAADERVHAHVHPQQQFASTLYQSVDHNSHLDVVNKLGFVQSFLTKLRNRCTEVETLASGPGIVFSMKDFNECLQVFCQGLLKYGEAELRSRVETQHIRQNQYQHLLYMKEKQALYFRRKCEQFLGDIDKLVNAKISQKGGQLLYELDVSSRELRVLRDNYNLMHSMMMEELRHEYMREIQEKENAISQLRERFRAHRGIVSTETTAGVSEIFKEKQDVLEKKRHDFDEVFTGPATLGKGMASSGPGNQHGGARPGSLPSAEQQESGANLELVAGPRRELLSLQRYMSKYKVMTMMKGVLAAERHEKELANQRAQLTSNAALWDQLAEAEKREQITKQELSLTKLSLASYEKLIEKLQGQLENLNNQKARLQQYKNSKSKRMFELENKMKDLEILENIDLNRILSELKARDRKIEGLETRVQRNEQTEGLEQENSKTVHALKAKLSMERELKLQAYDRLEGLRVEMRALEGKDMKSDLWKDKCRELFDICKELERENDDLKGLVKDANHANLLQTAGELEMNGGLQGLGGDAYHPETVAPGSGARSNLAPRGADRLVSSRTLGLGGGMGYGRHASGHGLGYATSGGSYPSGLQGQEAGSSLVNGRQAARKAGGGPVGSNLYQTNQDTLHSDGFQSHQLSGAYGIPQPNPGEAELLSLGSGGVAEGNVAGGGQFGPSGSLAGGVFGDPLASLQQPRAIMTAGGGARPQYRGAQVGSNRSKQPAAQKRLLTSQGPAGVRSIGKMGNRAGQRGPAGALNAGRAGPLGGSLQAKTRLHYASHNSGSLALAGANIQGQGRSVLPGVMDGQRLSGVVGSNPQQLGPQLKPGTLSSGANGPAASTMPRLPQPPVNVNINFNTTHITTLPPK